MFGQLRDRVDAALSGIAHVTEHVGSTAVPGLAEMITEYLRQAPPLSTRGVAVLTVVDDDENPEIAAALAKLAGQDAAAADDAQSALEWIAGEQGLAFITQERIQNFCW